MTTWATYRVQLNGEFTFFDAASISDYLGDLGVSHLYCSPYLQAAPGSTHGYDVTDPQHLNEELGGLAGHSEMVAALAAAGLGQLLDIVPNHMAAGASNRWWWDVLENGPSSRYARFFDIDWEGDSRKSAFKVLVPVLNDHYGRVLEAHGLRIERNDSEFIVLYEYQRLPISPRTVDDLLARAARRTGSSALAGLSTQFADLPPARVTDASAVVERHERKVELTAALSRLCGEEPPLGRALDAEVRALNEDADRLDNLLDRQNYRLARWRTASEELDYRRFFSITTLVGLREEDPEVFDESHKLIFELVEDGTLSGLRVDHIDGLRDPDQYLGRLAERTAGTYTVVEKILEPGERLRSSWATSGTSGYDFLCRVNNLFVETGNEKSMSELYTAFTGESADYEEVVSESKKQVMNGELAAEVDHVTSLLAELCDRHRRQRDHTRRELRRALVEFVAHFPVYRSYVKPGRPASGQDEGSIRRAMKATEASEPEIDLELLEFLANAALGAEGSSTGDEFAQRLQQLTAPVMAKGVEDTAFYRYNRFISLNEVGGDPSVFGRPAHEFHAATHETARQWPESMLTLSTHDTKRSADVRARLNVLSCIPEQWRAAVERWAEINEAHRRGDLPDRNCEYLVYQTLVGAWPIDAERLVGFVTKATKEAKLHTSWTDPVVEYDDAVESFVRSILGDSRFRAEVQRFLVSERVVELGRCNSLAQTALLLTCPGVADLYQGSELWDLSLVDPDNRRPVDYAQRRSLLSQVRGARNAADMTGEEVEAGAPKLLLVSRLLHHRRERPDSFDSHRYEPLEVSGEHAGAALGFLRPDLAVVVACRPRTDRIRADVELPTGSWRNVTTREPYDGGRHSLGRLFESFPVAVVARDTG